MRVRARTHLATTFEQDHRSFGESLGQLRRRLATKQAAISSEVGCTDAAISHWESGGRLPTTSNLGRLLVVVARSGATAMELLELRAAWVRDKTSRGHPSGGADRRTPSPPARPRTDAADFACEVLSPSTDDRCAGSPMTSMAT